MILDATLSTFAYLNPFSQYFKIKTCKIVSVEHSTVIIKVLDHTISTKKKEEAMQQFTIRFGSLHDAKKFATDLEKSIQINNRFIGGPSSNLKRLFGNHSGNNLKSNE